MPLESFEVWNFKSIEYSGVISLRKIMILIGYNGSGKSSLFEALLLMKQSLYIKIQGQFLVQ
ncbi:MAG: AAA family ATPase [Candidatus Hodarchaeota archaeon]